MYEYVCKYMYILSSSLPAHSFPPPPPSLLPFLPFFISSIPYFPSLHRPPFPLHPPPLLFLPLTPSPLLLSLPSSTFPPPTPLLLLPSFFPPSLPPSPSSVGGEVVGTIVCKADRHKHAYRSFILPSFRPSLLPLPCLPSFLYSFLECLPTFRFFRAFLTFLPYQFLPSCLPSLPAFLQFLYSSLPFFLPSCRRGYIAMLAVDDKFRKKGIGSTLVFFPSFRPFFLSFCPSFLPSFLPCVFPSLFPCFLPCFIPAFRVHFL